MSTCIVDVPGCADCERTSRAKGDDHRCDDLCRLIARRLRTDEDHAATHAAQHCSSCGAWEIDENGRGMADGPDELLA